MNLWVMLYPSGTVTPPPKRINRIRETIGRKRIWIQALQCFLRLHVVHPAVYQDP